MLFDGARDGLLVETNPVAGARAFTVEAVIRPDAGGAAEQRWLHIQETAADNRVMLETRLRGDVWFLDTFVKNGAGDDKRLTLFDEPFKHAVGAWYHVALVYDGATLRNYVDGREELSGPLSVGPLAGGAHLHRRAPESRALVQGRDSQGAFHATRARAARVHDEGLKGRASKVSDENTAAAGVDFRPAKLKRRSKRVSMETVNSEQQESGGAAAAALGGWQHVNWSTAPVERPAEGIERQMVVGAGLMVCRFRFAPFLVTPEHSHPHEQMSIVVKGRVRFFVEGEERVASPGDVLHFPPDCWHGATMMEEEVELIDIFSPVREDFLKG